MIENLRGLQKQKKRDKPVKIYVVTGSKEQSAYCQPNTDVKDFPKCNGRLGSILINPFYAHYGVWNDDDKVRDIPLPASIAHELGHLQGEEYRGGKDGEEENIRVHENPVRKELGYPLRDGYNAINHKPPRRYPEGNWGEKKK
jgi:hypothetical protein